MHPVYSNPALNFSKTEQELAETVFAHKGQDSKLPEGTIPQTATGKPAGDSDVGEKSLPLPGSISV